MKKNIKFTTLMLQRTNSCLNKVSSTIPPFRGARGVKLHPPSCTSDAVIVLKHHGKETDDDREQSCSFYQCGS